jgi:hypothetical protein
LGAVEPGLTQFHKNGSVSKLEASIVFNSANESARAFSGAQYCRAELHWE